MNPALCVIAHPDDLEPQAGGTVARLSQTREVTVVYLCAPTINGDGLDKDREVEAIRAATYLGIVHVEFLRWPAEEVTDDYDHIAVVDRLRKELGANLIIGHGLDDSQQHHRAAAQIVRTLARRNRIDLWEMDHSMPAGLVSTRPRPNLFVDVTETYGAKMTAVDCYPSMEARHPGWREGIIARDRYYGFMLNQDGDTGTTFAEGFVARHSAWF